MEENNNNIPPVDNNEKQDYIEVLHLLVAIINAVLAPFLYMFILFPAIVLNQMAGLSRIGGGGTPSPLEPISLYIAVILAIIYLLLSVYFLIKYYIKCIKSLKTIPLKIIVPLMTIVMYTPIFLYPSKYLKDLSAILT